MSPDTLSYSLVWKRKPSKAKLKRFAKVVDTMNRNFALLGRAASYEDTLPNSAGKNGQVIKMACEGDEDGYFLLSFTSLFLLIVCFDDDLHVFFEDKGISRVPGFEMANDAINTFLGREHDPLDAETTKENRLVLVPHMYGSKGGFQTRSPKKLNGAVRRRRPKMTRLSRKRVASK